MLELPDSAYLLHLGTHLIHIGFRKRSLDESLNFRSVDQRPKFFRHIRIIETADFFKIILWSHNILFL